MKRLLSALLLIALFACNSNEFKGIRLGNAITTSLTKDENHRLINLINEVLNLQGESLPELINFDCGGASYRDLGSVIAQIVNQTGEKNFIALCRTLTGSDKLRLIGLVDVGLKQGVELKKGTKNTDFKTAFPDLYGYLNPSNREASKRRQF
jgi:hypothetical protein